MLRSDRVEDRAEATAQLRALGLRASDAILKLEADPDLEVRLRAQELLRSLTLLGQIPQRILDAFPRVAQRLAWDDAAVGTVLEMLGENADVGWDEGYFFQTFLEGVILLQRYPDLIRKEDLEALATRAFQELPSYEEKALLCQWVSGLALSAAIPEICALVADPEPRIRIDAIRVVGQLRAANALGETVPALDDPEPWVANEAYDTIRSVGPEKAVDPLVAFLARAPSPSGSVKALRLLARTEDRNVLPAIRSCFQVGDPCVRMAAVQALADVAQEDSFPELRNLFQDPAEDVRQSALGLIVKLAMPGAGEAALDRLADPSVRVRQEALFALATLGKREAAPSILRLLKDPTVRQTAIYALASLDAKEALPDIQRYAKDTDTYVCRQVAIAVERLQKSSGPR